MSQHLDAEEIDCERFDDLLDGFIDEDLDPINRRRFEQHLNACSLCSGRFQLAQRIQDGLRSLPIVECPDHVVVAAHEAIGLEATDLETTGIGATGIEDRPADPPTRLETPPALPFLNRQRTARQHWRPILALAAMLLLVIALPRLVSPPEPTALPTPMETAQVDLEGYSAEEIAQAEAEVKLALAYLGHITEASGRTVAQEVLGEKVILPLSRSVRQALTRGGNEDAS